MAVTVEESFIFTVGPIVQEDETFVTIRQEWNNGTVAVHLDREQAHQIAQKIINALA
jgi:hypothetical protein